MENKMNERINHEMLIMEEDKEYDITQCEKGIYANCIMFPEGYAYHETYGYCIEKSVNNEVLLQALKNVIENNKILRSIYIVNQDGKVVRKVKKNVIVELPVVSLKKDENIEEAIKCERRKQFDFEHGPLFRFTMYVDEKGEKKLVTCFHHIVYDWNSAQIFITEVKDTYKKLIHGEQLILDDENNCFDKYVDEEKAYLNSEKANEDREYWMKSISLENKFLTIAGADLETGIIANKGNYSRIFLQSDFMKEIETADFGKNVSVFVKMLSAYLLLLYNYSMQKNLRIGVPIGRRNAERENSIGCYINVIVMSMQLNTNMTIQEFVQGIRDIALDGMEHGSYPYHELSKDISKAANMLIPQICQSAFYFNEWNITGDQEFGGTLIKEAHQVGDYDLSMAVYKKINSEIEVLLKYNENLFDSNTISHMLIDYQDILKKMIKSKNLTLETFMNGKTGNKVNLEKTFIELFKEQVKKNPNAVAVVCGKDKMTYQELYLKAGKLAKYLQNEGVKKGTYIGIMLRRSTKLLTALIAVQMAGGVYIPIDPNYPSERIQYMFEESDLKYLICERDECKEHEIDVEKKIYINDLKEELQSINMTIDEIVCEFSGDDLAYLLFTSGSTGKPKGIMIPHGALSNFLISMSECPGCDQTDTLLAITTICFDIAGLEMYLMLSVGGKIEILSDELIRDGIQLLEKMRSTQFTIIQATPATWQMLLAAGWNEHMPIKILCGGEALSRELADKLMSLCDEVYNMYGPTETTIWSTVSKVEENSPITLGQPIRNTNLYVFDEDMNEVNSGEIGELYIGGAGVAKGYINRPEETNLRFISYDENHDRIYKTGDLVKKMDDGNLIYIGRSDFQVKINGFRIELGEIEEALLRNNAVGQAVVVVGKQSNKLCAYLIAEQGADHITNEEFEDYLRKTLPEYMVPKQYYYMESYPLTLNNKVDRKKLAELNGEVFFDENTIIYGFNQTETDYQKDKMIHELFMQQVKKTPDDTAVIFEGKKMKYKELDEESNKLANYLLKEHHLRPATPVAIFMERSELLTVSIMGVLKAGGVYVPIDPHTPEQRIKTILEDTGISIVITSKCFISMLNRLQFECTNFNCYICMDVEVPCSDEQAVDNNEASNNFSGMTDDINFIEKNKKKHGSSMLCDSTEPKLNGVTSENPAYIIFTSGSTGKPKGVVINHRNVVNFMNGICERIDFSKGKRILSVTTVSFDIFALENFIPLCNGMTIVMTNEGQQMEAKELNSIILEYNVDMLQTTPSRVGMILQDDSCKEGISKLKEIMIGGEPFPKILLEKLKRICSGKIYNMYGPTETTVWSTIQELTGKDSINIGKPIANTYIYILNENHLAKIGEIGELCIAGDGVAIGYFNDEKQTAEKFVEDPFRSGGRMYRTGDLAKWLPSGEIEFIGRADHQVKIRGYRIELGEIETHLCHIEAIKESVVIEKKDQNENSYLCAYLVSSEKIDVRNIRERLLNVLPDYMVPSAYVQIEEIPLTTSGKINRKKLMEQDDEYAIDEECIPPSNETEEKLIAIWKEILGVSRVGIQNDFFDLGGHSLKATYLTSKIKSEFHVEMPLKIVFEKSTVEQMASYIIDKTNAGINSDAEEKKRKCKKDDVALIKMVAYYICKIAAEIQHMDKDSIRTDVNLGQYNFDSISFTRLCVEVNKHYNIKTNPSVFYTYQTIEAFSEYVAKTFYEQVIEVEDIVEHKANVQEDTVDVAENKEVFKNVVKEVHEEFAIENTSVCGENSVKEENGIAVIGIGGLMPGSESLDVFWDNLISEKDLITVIPDTRWNYRKYEEKEDGDPNRVTCKWGAFAPDVDKFDSDFFCISPREAESMDPQQRIMLQVVWETIENAGYNPKKLSGQEVGVYIGATTIDYMEITTRKSSIKSHTLTGVENSVIPGRISYWFNFTGPSEIVDTACSSSLVSVCNAVNALLNKECKYAIAGGVNFLLSPFYYVALEKGSMLSPDGRCKAFDASANGYSRGEGAGALLLKPLCQAIKDGDHIYGVIRGAAVNHGGKANSLTAPNPNAQRDVIKKAFDKAGFDPSTVDYVETHGTGTALGDPIEINGLTMAFNDLYKEWGIKNNEVHCGLGAVKTNIGHLEAAAGIAGMLKMLLSMEHKIIPANIHFKELNPYINLDKTPFYIRSKTEEWKNQIRDGRKIPLRGGVSSFGFGGTNAHILIEEYIPQKNLNAKYSGKKEYIIPLSAQYVNGLSKAVFNLYEYVLKLSEEEKTANLLNRMAYTLQTGRQAMKYRVAFTVHNVDELEEVLGSYIENVSEYETEIKVRERQGWESSVFDLSDIHYIIDRYIENGEMSKVARLWERGFDFEWCMMYTETIEKLPLPSYPFNKMRYFLKLDSNNVDYIEQKPHPMIDGLLTEESLGDGLTFQKILTYQDRVVRDHVVRGNCFMPGTCYLELALEGVDQVEKVQAARITNVVWYHPLTVSSEKSKDIRLHLNKREGVYQYQVKTSDTNSPIYGSGQIELNDLEKYNEVFDIQTIKSRCNEVTEKEDFYRDIIEQEEINYGPYFQGINRIYRNGTEALGVVELSDLVREQQEFYLIHPVVMDCALQCMSKLIRHLSNDEITRVPFSSEEILINGSLQEERYYIYLTAKNLEIYNVYILNESGQVLVYYKNLVCRAMEEKQYYFIPKYVMVDSNKNNTSVRPEGKNIIVYQDDSMSIVRMISDNLNAEAIEVHVSQQEYLKELIKKNRIGTIYITSTLISSIDILSEKDFRQTEKNGIYLMFDLLKALIDVSYHVDICIITNNAYQIKNEKHFPVHASLNSFSKSAMLENPNLTIRLYDLDCNNITQIKKEIPKIIEHYGAMESCIIRDNLWYERKIYRYQIDQHTVKTHHFKNKGTYLIVGMGGIGKEIGKYLAKQYNTTILFISKSTLDEDKMSVMEYIRNVGGDAYYYQADITDSSSVNNAMKQIRKENGKINGVIIGAMVLKDKSLITMTKQDMEDVLRIKAQGTIVLWKALKDFELDFVLFLSSVNSLIGSAGQTNYCAACAVQDELAYAMSENLEIPVKIINWSYWGSVGAVSSNSYNERLMERGLLPVQIREGMDAIEKVLADTASQVAFFKASDEALEKIGFDTQNKIVKYVETIRPLSLESSIIRKPDDEVFRLRQGIQNVEKYGARYLLEYFQKRNILSQPCDCVEVMEVCQKLNVIEKYKKLIQAFFNILEREGYVQCFNKSYYATKKVCSDSANDFFVDRYPELSDYIRLLKICINGYDDVLSGKIKYTDVMFPGGSKELVTGIYKGNAEIDYYNGFVADSIEAYIVARVKQDPNCIVRIVEIGAGTGGTSCGVFKVIDKYRKNIQYFYTDISASFTNYGEQTYGSNYPFVEFKVLNIEKNPLENGFESGSFDIALGTDVLHATTDMATTMNHIKLLLKKNGIILINEMTCFEIFSTLTFGLSDGWWFFTDDLRIPDSPLLSLDMWERMLNENGYENIEVMPKFENRDKTTRHVIKAQSDGCVIYPITEKKTVIDFNHNDVQVNKESSSGKKLKKIVKKVSQNTPKVKKGILESDIKKLVIDWVMNEFSSLLKIDKKKIDIDSNIENMGMDSLMIIEVHAKWSKIFKQIPSTLMFEYTTIKKISDYLLDNYETELKGLFETETSELEEVYVEEYVEDFEELYKDDEIISVEENSVENNVKKEAKIEEKKDDYFESKKDIAIIGVAGRYPMADDIYEFWDNLKNGRNCIETIPNERWDWEKYFDPTNQIQGKSYSKWGGFLKDIKSFDAEFFGFTEKEAKELDPQERILLETTWSVLDDAGYPGRSLIKEGKIVGSFFGTMYEGYNLLATKAWENGLETNAQAAHWILPNRIAHYFDFKGPSISFDTACASSLTAIHYACRSIQNGECDMAVAGGINLIVSPRQHVRLGNLNMLSHSGKTMSFGQEADGFVESEGVGVVLLKPLDDAIRDNDYIYGIVKASNVNCNGGENAFFVPNITTQSELIKKSLMQANIKCEDINYVEAHVAGTLLGDPVEVRSLNKVFCVDSSKQVKCPIGTVKANIGHCEAASGVAALTKVLLQMRYKKLIPSINCDPVNKLIAIEDSAFYINKEFTDWNVNNNGNGKRSLRRACINSNGAGGSNTNMIVEEYNMDDRRNIENDNEHVIVLSAKNQDSLKKYASALRNFLKSQEQECYKISLADIAFTLQVGREAMKYRVAFIVNNKNELFEKLGDIAHSLDGDFFIGTVVSENLTSDFDVKNSTGLQLAKAWTEGVQINWKELHDSGNAGRIPLPSYQFIGEKYWLDITSNQTEEENDEASVLERYTGSEMYIRGHYSFGKSTIMGMTYVSLALGLLQKIGYKNGVAIKGFTFLEPVTLDSCDNAEVRIQCNQSKEILCEVSWGNRNESVARAKVCENVEFVSYKVQLPDFSEYQKISGEQLYLKKPGIYGKVLHGMETVYRKADDIWGKLKLSEEMCSDIHSYCIHPVLLDSSVLCRMAQEELDDKDMYLPLMIKEIYAAGVLRKSCYCHVKRHIKNAEIWEGDVLLIDEESSSVIVEMRGVVCKRIFEENEVREIIEDNVAVLKDVRTKNGTDELVSSIVEYLKDKIERELCRSLNQDEYNKNLMVIGCDSRIIMLLSSEIQNDLQTDFYPTAFFEHPSIAGMAIYIKESFSEQFIRYINSNESNRSHPEITSDDFNSIKTEITESVKEKCDEKKNENLEDDIAIIGISGVFPQASNLEEFWENIVQNKNSVTIIPEDRWDWQQYYKESPDDKDKTNIIWGGFLKDVDKFDADFFGISPREARHMDPQQRIMLELAWKVIEDAGYDPNMLSGSKTGVFIGVADGDYRELSFDKDTTNAAQLLTGTSYNILTGRISYFFDFHGPSEPLDNACASSLVSIIHAVDAIQNKRCDMALAGGVHIMLNPELYIAFDSLGILSSDGTCRAFDKEANGTVRGEGAGLVMLKRLKNAVADNDHIYAIIKGTGISHGGKANSMTAPNPLQQEAAIVEAFERGNIDPATVSYVETHGTGTILGDPIEITALKSAFNKVFSMRNEHIPVKPYCRLGSVKTQIGHLESASGIAGLLKVLLCMEHGIIPGIQHFKQLNPYINLADSPFYIEKEAKKWERLKDENGAELPYRAGISSFGFSGVNAHIILEEYKYLNKAEQNQDQQLFLFSAKNKNSLHTYVKNFVSYLEHTAEEKLPSLSDIAFTLKEGRALMEERIAVIASNYRELKTALEAYCSEVYDISNLYCKENAAIKTNDTQYSKDALQWLEGYKTHSAFKGNKTALPTYAFEKKSYWLKKSEETRMGKNEKINSILLDRLEQREPEIIFSKTLKIEDFYVRDHVVSEKRILPGVIYLEMARQAGEEVLRNKRVSSIRNIVWLQAIEMDHIVDNKVNVKLQNENNCIAFEVRSDNKGIHGQGTLLFTNDLKSEAVYIDFTKIKERCFNKIKRAEMYRQYEELGFHYGDTFKPVESIFFNEKEAIGYIRSDKSLDDEFDKFKMHPVMLEGSLQVAGFIVDRIIDSTSPYIPFSIERLDIYDTLPKECLVYVEIGEHTGNSSVQKANVTICDMTGRVLVKILNYITRSFEKKERELKTIKRDELHTSSLSGLNDYKDNSYEDTIAKTLKGIVADIVGLEEEEINVNEELENYNMDSMLLMEFSNKINGKFHINLTPAMFFELEPLTLNKVSKYMLEHYGEKIKENMFSSIFSDKKEEDKKTLNSLKSDFTAFSEKEKNNAKPIEKEPIAVIGMAGRMPMSKDLEEFWYNLANKKDMVEEIPEQRFDWHKYYGDPINEDGKTNSRWGGFIYDIDKFDAEFFGITPKEAKYMDPQQRIMFELVWELLEDAGYTKTDVYGSKTGVYMGVSNLDYMELVHKQKIDALAMTGNCHPMMVNKISHFYNFTGPSEPVDTLCSSSLVALHRAVQDIRSGMCETAIVGGINVIISPTLYLSYGNAKMLSSSGKCKTFDRDADGFVRAEGAGAIYLKPLSKAKEDKDHIYGIIRGSAVNHNGHTKSLTAPSPKAQAEVIEMALNDANVSFDAINYLELHGTGTPLGDPIEINGLKMVYNNMLKSKKNVNSYRCYLGAVKTNVGHLESAAGIAGVIKVLLSMKYKTIPAIIHLKHINPYIDLTNTPFYIPTESTVWEQLTDKLGTKLPRRAGISSFGAGGVNAHVIFEEYEEKIDQYNEKSSHFVDSDECILGISARDKETLNEYVGNVIQYLDKCKDYSLSDISYSSLITREAMRVRLAVRGKNVSEIIGALKDYVNGRSNNLLYLKQNIESDDICQRWVNGEKIDWKKIFQSKEFCKVPFPKYPFKKESYWIEVPQSGNDNILSQEITVCSDEKELCEKYNQNVVGEDFMCLKKWTEVSLTDLISENMYRNTIIFSNEKRLVHELASFSSIIRFEKTTQFRTIFENIKREKWIPEVIVFAFPLDENYQPENNIFDMTELIKSANIVFGSQKLHFLYVFDEQNSINDIYHKALSGFFKAVVDEYKYYSVELLCAERENVSLQCIEELKQNVFVPYQNIIYKGKRYQEQLYAVELQNKAESIPFKERGVYLITGGAGKFGQILTKYLIDNYHSNVIVTGLKERSDKTVINRFDSTGTVTYVRADITKDSDVIVLKRIIDERFEGIDGIFHLAGIVQDGFIYRNTKEKIQQVIDPKVKGVRLLDKLASNYNLDFFILFSSISAIVECAGQSDYAYANSFMDNFAAMREKAVEEGKCFGKTCSINWPLLLDGGMTAKDERFKGILSSTCIKYLKRALDYSNIIVLSGDINKIKNLLGVKEISELISDTNTACHEEKVIQYSENNTLFQDIVKIIKQSISIISEIPESRIENYLDFEEYGIDSVMLLRLGNMMAPICGNIPNTIFFEYRNIENLAEYFTENYENEFQLYLSDKVIKKECGKSEKSEIAIIGMSGRYSKAEDLDQFWYYLASKKQGAVITRDYPWNMSPLKEYAEGIDLEFFEISSETAENIPVEEKILLEELWKAIESAGYCQKSLNEKIGIFIGIQTNSRSDDNVWYEKISRDIIEVIGIDNKVVQCACGNKSSTRLIQSACDSLNQGEINLAIVASVCFRDNDFAYNQELGEGIGVLLLKNKNDAVAEQDIIYGVIKNILCDLTNVATEQNQNIIESYQKRISQFLSDSKVSEDDIHFIELNVSPTICNNIVDALSNVLSVNSDQNQKIPVGFTKDNTGELGCVNGMAQIMKVILQFQANSLTPVLVSDDIRRMINEKNIFYTPSRITSWREDVQKEKNVVIITSNEEVQDALIISEMKNKE